MTNKEWYDKGMEDMSKIIMRQIGRIDGILSPMKLTIEGPFEDFEGYNPPKEEELTIDLSGVLPHVKGTPHISHDLAFNEDEEET